MFPNGADFLSCLMKSYFSSVSRKSRDLSSSAISRRVTSSDDSVLVNFACGNADAEVNVSKWCLIHVLYNEILFFISYTYKLRFIKLSDFPTSQPHLTLVCLVRLHVGMRMLR